MFLAFKEYLIFEKIDFGSSIEKLVKGNFVPVLPEMMKQLGYNFDEYITCYHFTNIEHLKEFKKISKKSQISCFTKPSVELTKLPSNPNILLKIYGRAVIEGDSDIYTYIDETGRRWIKIDAIKSKESEKLTFFLNGIRNKLLKEFNGKITKRFLIKYLKEIKNLLDYNYKLFNSVLKNNSTDYNEVVVDNVKVLGGWGWNTDIYREEFEKQKIKYLGVMDVEHLLKLK